MKLIDALNKVNKHVNNLSHPAFSIAESFGMYGLDWEKAETRLKGYWLNVWICTDEWVGQQAVFFDDVLVGYTEQLSRKGSLDIYFLNKEFAENVKQWIKECTEEDETEFNIALQDSLDTEFPEAGYVPYTILWHPSMILDGEVIYNGSYVTIVDKLRQNWYEFGSPFQVKVKTQLGEELLVPLEDIKIPLRIKKESSSLI